VAVIDDATAYGKGIADEVEKTLKAANIKVLPREQGTDKTTDWKAILTKVKGKSPEAVFYGGMDATGGPLLKQGASSASRPSSRSATARAPTT
jgi:branched-chain amino acid transport system substrate-binding protein